MGESTMHRTIFPLLFPLLLTWLVHSANATVWMDLCSSNECASPYEPLPQPIILVYAGYCGSGIDDKDAGAQDLERGLANMSKPLYENGKIMIRLMEPESLRYTLDVTLTSSIGPDIMLWQSVVAFDPDHLYDLTSFAQHEDIPSRYPPGLVQHTIVDGKILGVVDRSTSWGIWFNVDMFVRLGLSPPVTWSDFLHVCSVIKQAGIVPIALNALDTWTIQTWWSYIALRRGGHSWWQEFIAQEINLVTNEIHIQTWQLLKQLQDLGYFPTIHDAQVDFETALVKWAVGDWAMILSTGVAGGVPGLVGRATDQFDFFAFPTIPTIPIISTDSNETNCEFAAYGVYVVNKLSKNINLTLEVLRMLASDEYAVASLGSGSTYGLIPGPLSVRSRLPQDGFLVKLAGFLDNVQVVDLLDVTLPLYTNYTKPLYVSFFSANVSVTQLCNQLENIRQEVMLGRANPPTVSPPAGYYPSAHSDSTYSVNIELDTSTANATIYYSLSCVLFDNDAFNDAFNNQPESFNEYKDPIPLITPNQVGQLSCRLNCYTGGGSTGGVIPALLDSPMVETMYIIGPSTPLTIGDTLVFTFPVSKVGPWVGSVVCAILMWQFVASWDISILIKTSSTYTCCRNRKQMWFMCGVFFLSAGMYSVFLLFLSAIYYTVLESTTSIQPTMLLWWWLLAYVPICLCCSIAGWLVFTKASCRKQAVSPSPPQHQENQQEVDHSHYRYKHDEDDEKKLPIPMPIALPHVSSPSSNNYSIPIPIPIPGSRVPTHLKQSTIVTVPSSVSSTIPITNHSTRHSSKAIAIRVKRVSCHTRLKQVIRRYGSSFACALCMEVGKTFTLLLLLIGVRIPSDRAIHGWPLIASVVVCSVITMVGLYHYHVRMPYRSMIVCGSLWTSTIVCFFIVTLYSVEWQWSVSSVDAINSPLMSVALLQYTLDELLIAGVILAGVMIVIGMHTIYGAMNGTSFSFDIIQGHMIKTKRESTRIKEEMEIWNDKFVMLNMMNASSMTTNMSMSMINELYYWKYKFDGMIIHPTTIGIVYSLQEWMDNMCTVMLLMRHTSDSGRHYIAAYINIQTYKNQPCRTEVDVLHKVNMARCISSRFVEQSLATSEVDIHMEDSTRQSIIATLAQTKKLSMLDISQSVDMKRDLHCLFDVMFKEVSTHLTTRTLAEFSMKRDVFHVCHLFLFYARQQKNKQKHLSSSSNPNPNPNPNGNGKYMQQEQQQEQEQLDEKQNEKRERQQERAFYEKDSSSVRVDVDEHAVSRNNNAIVFSRMSIPPPPASPLPPLPLPPPPSDHPFSIHTPES